MAFRGDRKTQLCKKCKISSPVKNTYTKCNREFKFLRRGAKATESKQSHYYESIQNSLDKHAQSIQRILKAHYKPFA